MMKNLFIYCFVFLSIIFTQSIVSQKFDNKQLEEKIDALIPKQINDTTPGLVVGVVQKGKLIFSKGYGLANLAYGIPNDSKMVYNIGSVTKQFLGYAFAMLHVKGDLNIDDPVSKYLKNWPEFEHKVTLRNLLTHTSGYREAYTMSSLAGRPIGIDRLSREECLNVVRRQPKLEFDPGSRYTYNSTAWVILAEVLEKVVEEKADIWVEKNILRPLGMNSTQIESYVGEVITNAAESYSLRRDGYSNEKSNRAIFGAAEIYSSIEDLVKWIDNLRVQKVGNDAVNKLFLDPFILNDGSNSFYALGIGNQPYRGVRRYRHTGGHEAFITQLSYYPDYELGIITISNFGGRGRISTTAIADIFLSNEFSKELHVLPKSVKLNDNDLQKHEGVYVASTLNSVNRIVFSEGSLQLNGRFNLVPVSKTVFRIKGQLRTFEFHEERGKKQMIIKVNGSKQVFNLSEPVLVGNNDLKIYEGDYWSEELETSYNLSIKNGKLVIKHRWLGEIPLNAISKDFYGVNGLFAKFNRDDKGNIINFSVNTGRTLNVIFKRK